MPVGVRRRAVDISAWQHIAFGSFVDVISEVFASAFISFIASCALSPTLSFVALNTPTRRPPEITTLCLSGSHVPQVRILGHLRKYRLSDTVGLVHLLPTTSFMTVNCRPSGFKLRASSCKPQQLDPTPSLHSKSKHWPKFRNPNDTTTTEGFGSAPAQNRQRSRIPPDSSFPCNTDTPSRTLRLRLPTGTGIGTGKHCPSRLPSSESPLCFLQDLKT
ncbi:hypothetical protein GALMADRAFT_714755 [Galerina marginata CBS 339.88]|uniref:Uncharacterized protein n=1 Tax=Galerina marginata (strain CBS 339.88) TaxID=685588 RepID=A0A067TMQ8_GALM3|nr:hypothetical protein GALMADRAFT_714755 [Galerina marginata CBS 339.88]